MTNEQIDRGIAKAKELFNEGHFNDVLLTAYLLLILEAMKVPAEDPVEEIRKINGPMSLQNLSDKCTGCIEGCDNCTIGKCNRIPNLMEEPETETI